MFSAAGACKPSLGHGTTLAESRHNPRRVTTQLSPSHGITLAESRHNSRWVADAAESCGDRPLRFSTTFQRIVITLHVCDMIEEEMLSRRKTLYTLKTAA